MISDGRCLPAEALTCSQGFLQPVATTQPLDVLRRAGDACGRPCCDVLDESLTNIAQCINLDAYLFFVQLKFLTNDKMFTYIRL